MARTTISLPDELHERLEQFKDQMNVSLVCQEAIEREVQIKEALAGKKNMKLKERLNTEMDNLRADVFAEGRKGGIKWAEEHGELEELMKMKKWADAYLFDNTAEGIDIKLSQEVFEVFEEQDGILADFEKLGYPEAVTDDYCNGFIVGAAEAYEKATA